MMNICTSICSIFIMLKVPCVVCDNVRQNAMLTKVRRANKLEICELALKPEKTTEMRDEGQNNDFCHRD